MKKVREYIFLISYHLLLIIIYFNNKNCYYNFKDNYVHKKTNISLLLDIIYIYIYIYISIYNYAINNIKIS